MRPGNDSFSIRSIVWASVDSVRPQMVTVAPSATRRSAHAAPFPVPPPVTIAEKRSRALLVAISSRLPERDAEPVLHLRGIGANPHADEDILRLTARHVAHHARAFVEFDDGNHIWEQ